MGGPRKRSFIVKNSSPNSYFILQYFLSTLCHYLVYWNLRIQFQHNIGSIDTGSPWEPSFQINVLGHLETECYIDQTLSIWLGIQFRQRNGQIKDKKPNFFFYIFGLAWPWDPRGPGTYSKFVESPLMIDLWMEECQILMIFSYFSWKWRWSPAQD